MVLNSIAICPPWPRDKLKNWNAYCVNQRLRQQRKQHLNQNKTSQRLRLSLKLSKVTNQPITRRKIKATKVTSKLRSRMAKSLLSTTKVKPRLSLKATATMANSLTTKINVITNQTLTLTAAVVVAAVRTVAVTTVKMLTWPNPRGLLLVSIRNCQRS